MNARLPDDIRALLTAISEALDVPPAATVEDEQTRAIVLRRRAGDAQIMLAAVLRGESVASCTDQLRGWTAEKPITYAVYEPREQDGDRP